MPSPTTDIQPRSHVTVEDIFAMEDDKRYEVIGGEIHMVPPPGSSHQELSATLLALLLSNTSAPMLSVGSSHPGRLDPCRGRLRRARHRVRGRGSDRHRDHARHRGRARPRRRDPIEVPASRRRDQIAKYALYERHGIPHYWIVDPIDRTLVAHTLRDGRYVREASL